MAEGRFATDRWLIPAVDGLDGGAEDSVVRREWISVRMSSEPSPESFRNFVPSYFVILSNSVFIIF